MKRGVVFFMMFLLTGFGGRMSRLWAQEQALDGVIAIIGEEIILKSELIQFAQGYALQMNVNPSEQPDAFNRLKKDVLDNMINEKVLLFKAKEDTITVEDQEVEAQLESRIEQIVQQLGSREKVESYFGKPIRKIKSDYREEIRKQMIVQKVRQKRLANVQVSRREVREFYEAMKDSLPSKRPMVKLRHIMLDIRPGQTARQKAIREIQEIQERLRNGESFEELARIYSQDPGTAAQGGDLGFVERGSLFQTFEEAAFRLEPGEVSDMVETPIGFHLIKLEEKRGDKVHVRHILIRLDVSDTDEDQILAKLDSIRTLALEGRDFAELAREYSDDQTTRDQGGDLGWLPPDELQIQEFVDALKGLEPGEISKPFRTQFGYHLIKLEDKTEGRPLSLDEDYDQIKAWALNMKEQRILNDWIGEIKKDVYINIKEDLL